jgi:predicted N-acetyltransferase YhbS
MTTHPVMRALTPDDLPEVTRLHERAFGPGRFARTAYRVREGRDRTAAVSPYCRAVVLGTRLAGALIMTEAKIGGVAGVALLGPIAVDAALANQGYGRRMIGEALEAARAGGVRIVVLVGDAPYYGPLGFKPVPAGQITLPGPVNPARLLAAELESGAMATYRGPITAV